MPILHSSVNFDAALFLSMSIWHMHVCIHNKVYNSTSGPSLLLIVCPWPPSIGEQKNSSCLSVCLLPFLFPWMPACLPLTCPTFLPPYWSACLLTYLPASFLICLPPYLSACLILPLYQPTSSTLSFLACLSSNLSPTKSWLKIFGCKWVDRNFIVWTDSAEFIHLSQIK